MTDRVKNIFQSILFNLSILQVLTVFIYFSHLFFPDTLRGEVFLTPEKAMQARFPGASFRKIPLYISKEERELIEKELNQKLTGRFFTFHAAVINKKISGFVYFDTHTVRTKEQTIAVYMNLDGSILSVDLISFYEPGEYAPSLRFLRQFTGFSADNSKVIFMTGATLTSNAVLKHVRLASFLFHSGREKGKW